VDQSVRDAIFKAVDREPFAKAMGLRLIELEEGYSKVGMKYRPDLMDNIYSRAHGGAIFSLIDEAFETAAQTHGTIAVALNVNITYICSPEPGTTLNAEAREISGTRRTANYDIKITNAQNGALVASCQALAYRTGKPIPFL